MLGARLGAGTGSALMGPGLMLTADLDCWRRQGLPPAPTPMTFLPLSPFLPP